MRKAFCWISSRSRNRKFDEGEVACVAEFLRKVIGTHPMRPVTVELQQRAGELALINSIQEGVAAELNFQAIVDLVGDKVRAVLNTENMGIWAQPVDVYSLKTAQKPSF